ncbi:MAG TPA: PilZ domain-containing protein [Lachnospiraceae bacterium]|nr:PilZ domain-containing protein [Lachnospiraceae bacterium]
MEEETEFIETRRSQRIPIGMHLEVFSIFKQNNVHVSNMNVPIDVIDISRHGIGFVSKSVLPVGFYFDSRLKFEREYGSLKCVIRIVRRKKREDGLTLYGCEFVGLSPVFDYIFEDIEKSYKHNTCENN